METKVILEKIGGKPILPIRSLPDGASFKFADIKEGRFKNLKVLRCTDGGTYISGFRSNGDDWTPLGAAHQVSNETQVQIISEDEPAPVVEEKVEPVVVEEPVAEETPKEYVVPDGDFTVKMFIEANDIQPPSAHGAIKSLLGSGAIRSLGPRPTGNRGKPPLWFVKA
jgi:hypothetical protein